jgi:hypothetical protein
MIRSVIFEYRDLLSKTRYGLFIIHLKKLCTLIPIATDNIKPLLKSLLECGQFIGGKRRSNLKKITLILCLVPRSINKSISY